jgi:Cupredoxin-like domain
MNAVTKRIAHHTLGLTALLSLSCVMLDSPSFAATNAPANAKSTSKTVKVSLSEWKVELAPAQVPSGAVSFEVTNAGTIPHAFEVEGHGLEQSTPQIKPGATATLKLNLAAGRYETYCPVGKDSHKMLGMLNHLQVGGAKAASATAGKHEAVEKNETGEKYDAGHDADEEHEEHEMGAMAGMPGMREQGEASASNAKLMKVSGGGPVIQILPGPFPFADSAMAVINQRPPDQQADLTHKAQMGPYSNNVAAISGDISLIAIDRGASGDSVSGVAQFTSKDGARWKVVMDRVQTKDIPFNPRFGGVIMGLFYHGASGVHTPLVPTIQSSLALWAFAHLYKNDQLVTDNAMVHIMLLSRTRRTRDWALDCWDCSDRPIEELQLQVTPAPNTAPFDSPGGFLFVNWEKSSGLRASL